MIDDWMSGLRWCSLAALLMAGLVAMAVGCNEPPPATAQCSSDEDCSQGEVCDESVGVCESPRDGQGSQNNDNNQTNNTNNSDITPPNGGDNNDTNNDSNNDPLPPPGNNDDNNSEPGESCSDAFDGCDPADEDQGDYWCMEVDEDDYDGLCVPKCDDLGSADDCPTESYCLELEDIDEPGCVPSQCQTHSDCSDGTCMMFYNSYGECVDDGSGMEGDSCSGGPGGECVEGVICIEPDGETGQCRAVCDPWASDCSSPSDVCAVGWERTGYCTSDTTISGMSALDSCSPSGSWCDDAKSCVEFDTDNYCIKYCRPGKGDCPTGTVCDEYVFYNLDGLGVCFPPCDFDDDCGDDAECVNQVCRIPCTDPVDDCCPDDDPDCGAQCSAGGYCE